MPHFPRAYEVVGDRPLLVRTDSAHDCLENLGLFLTHNVDFIVKRNLRTLAPEHWLEMAKETQAAKEVPREGKQVWRGRMLSWLACDEKAGWKLATPTTPGARPVYQVYVVTEILELGLLAFDILRLVGQQIAKSANVPPVSDI